jgi:hypothetical protein
MNDWHNYPKNTLLDLCGNNLPNNQGTISISAYADPDDKRLFIVRRATRGNVINKVSHYEKIMFDGSSSLHPLDFDTGMEILKRNREGMPYNDCFIFYPEGPPDIPISMEETGQEHLYTSTGIKLWRHQEQMDSFLREEGSTVVSTHISPEGACNLRCPYCSVTYRDTHSHIPLPTIQDYVEKLQTRGLKAVILTGGGEPTVYKEFNDLVRWLKGRGLSVALITNGTLSRRVEDDVWGAFSWVRVSVNVFDGWEKKISIPADKVNRDCVIGCSMVYTVEHEATEEDTTNRIDLLSRVSAVADRCGAEYIRLLPNCLLTQPNLMAQHKSLETILKEVNDLRFFQQHKQHRAPRSNVCHQAYFRPYLSEEPWHEDGYPGSVYPCDSVVLNEGHTQFTQQYQICRPEEILDFMDRNIEMRFDPTEKCKGCVFASTVDMLEGFKDEGWAARRYYPESDTPLTHEEFI